MSKKIEEVKDMPKPIDLGIKAIGPMEFDSYVRVQYSGLYNMFSQEAREDAGLSKDEHFTIIKHYAELAEQYSDTIELYENEY